MIQKLSAEQCIGKQPPSLLSGLQPDQFRLMFNRKPFMIGHELSNNRLFSIESLVGLASQLPAEQVEYNSGNLPIAQDPALTPHNGLTVQQTIERIENHCSWMA